MLNGFIICQTKLRTLFAIIVLLLISPFKKIFSCSDLFRSVTKRVSNSRCVRTSLVASACVETIHSGRLMTSLRISRSTSTVVTTWKLIYCLSERTWMQRSTHVWKPFNYSIVCITITSRKRAGDIYGLVDN